MTKPTQTIEEPRKDYLLPLEEHEDGVSEGMAMINTAEINQQIATAHRYPRSITGFRRKVYEMVTLDVETAESCIYALPRDGKIIDGPSIRFAEILLVGWGNYRASTETIPPQTGDRFILAESVFFDLETNGAIKAKVMRRIVGKTSKDHPNGKPFGDDMIATTGNAAASIALRNAITRGIPKALWKELFDEAKKVAGGSAQTFGVRRDKVMKELGIQGATPDQIFALLGVKGLEDLETEHLVHLRGLQNAIKDGELAVDDVFGPQLKPGEVRPPQPKRSEFKDDKLGSQQQQPQPEPTAEKVVDEQPQPESKPGPDIDAAEADRLDFIKDAYADLEKQTKLIDNKTGGGVSPLREATIEAGVLNAEEEAAWVAACDAKGKAIMAAAKAKK